MRPVLFELWGLQVPAYGATMVVLFVSGLWLLWRKIRTFGVTGQEMLDLAAVAAGVFLFWAGCCALLAWLGIGGAPHLNALPVLAIGAFAFLVHTRRAALPSERIFDALAPIVTFALAAQYGVGTWLAGNAFGKPTALPWGISFPPGSAAYKAYGAQPLHPLQLYLAGLLLIIALVSGLAPLKLRDGQRALFTFVAISVAYLATSPLRGNTISVFAGTPPRMSELVAFFILFFCSIVAWRRRSVSVRDPSDIERALAMMLDEDDLQ
jgi:phosphatidylglycerol:prolipoprotein diacylglycerol transferase